MRIRNEPSVVSVQLSAAADPVAGHLAWGALVDQDRVAVPGPLEWLRDAGVRFEVLIASRHRTGRVLVERLAVDRAEVMGLRDSPTGELAVLQLAHPARHRPHAGGAFTRSAVADRVAGGTELWTALEEAGAVRPGLRTRPTRVLETVQAWEGELRLRLVHERHLPTPDELGLNICCIWGCRDCHPDGPW